MPARTPPPGATWRQPAGPDPVAAARQASAARPVRRPVRTTLAVVGFGGLCAALVWVALWLDRPPPTRVVAVTAGYETNLAIPHNVPGRSAAADLAKLAEASPAGSLRGDPAGPTTLTARTAWDAGLRSARERTVLVSIAAHGGTDAAGPFLLPTDAGPGPAAANRLRLSAVLDRLARLPATTKKVLLLDATAAPAVPTLGLLSNEFAAGLQTLAAQIEAIPNLVVLSASGPGERSWVQDATGRSAFGAHVVVGLAGAADANRDRRVTADELHRYLVETVHDHAARVWAAEQTPVRYPAGDEGDRRARAVVLASVPDDAVAPVPPSLPDATSAPVRAAWDRFREYDGRTPHPAAFDAHRWREYAAGVLRYEQLALAGDAASAAQVSAKLALAERAFDADRRVVYRSAGNTLSMPAVGGTTPPAPTEATKRAFDTVWAAGAEEIEKGLKGLLAATPRETVAELLLDRATLDPAANLAKAADLARRLDEPGRPRLSEIHLLVALAENLPADALPARPELVATALRVRRLAERAAVGPAGYAELVAPSLAERLRAADADRVRGEDLTFAASETDTKAAADALRSADAGYAKVIDAGQAFAAAFAARDRLFAGLPFLAEWAATDTTSASTDAVVGVWRQAHDLDDRLRQPVAADEAGKLAELGKTALDRFAELTARAEADAAALVPVPRAERTPPQVRTAVARVLDVPTLRPDTRQQLWTVAARLAREPAGVAGENLSQPPAASRRGSLTLAGFDRDTFDDLTGVRERLRAADTKAGAEIGDRIAKLPTAFQLASDRYADAATLDAGSAAALTADRLNRVTPAGVELPAGIDLRSHRRREFFTRLADRHAALAWAGGEQDAAGRAYLADAEQADPPPAVRDAVAGVRRRLDPGTSISLTPPPRTAVTDAGPVSLAGELRVVSPSPILPGRAIVWADGSPTRLSPPAAGTQTVRLDVSAPAATGRASPVGVPGGATLRGFFRGRSLRTPAPVDLYPEADVTAEYTPPPAGASVAVRVAPDLANRFGVGVGAVAIVLDCSGSTGGKESGRLAAGVKAALTLVAALPRDVTYIVWAFGQAGDAERRVDAAEQTIRRVFGPVQREPADASAAPRLAGVLGELVPYNQSPLYRAALKGREDVLAVEGYRAVVLVTDGADNRFAADREANPDAKTGPAVLRDKFKVGEVALHVLAHPPLSEEETAAQKELQAVVEKQTVPGLFLPADKADELAAALRAALAPRLRGTLVDSAGRKQPLDFGRPPADRWAGRLDAGNYRVAAEKLPGAEAGFTLRDGDRLLLSIVAGDLGPSVRRRPFADDFPGKPAAEADRNDWRLTVLQNQLTPTGGLSMLVALEPTEATVATGYRLPRPADVWFDLGTDLQPAFPPAVRWAPVWGYPAPAWELTVPAWPNAAATGTPARPVLRAWWTTDRPAQAAAEVPLAKLLDATGPVTVAVGRDEVTLLPVKGESPVVIRVAHLAGRPVVARLDGIPADGYVYRLYTRAGRATSTVRAADADLRQATVRLIPVADFQATARRLDLPSLPPPDANDARPRPAEVGPPAAK